MPPVRPRDEHTVSRYHGSVTGAGKVRTMKRLLKPSQSLAVAWLQANPNCLKADCFVITLPTGVNLYVTEGQWDLTVPAAMAPVSLGGQTTFKATQYGRWTRGKIESEASTKINSGTMSLTCVPQPGTNFPGTPLGVLNGALNHLFDGATVWVYTAYMALGAYGTVSVLETKFQGSITECPKLNRPLVAFEVADPNFLLNMKVPSRLFQSNCPWCFCDANCGLSTANYTVTFTAAAASTQLVLSPVTAFAPAAGYFAQGVVKCLTGMNAGLSQTVRAHASGKLTLTVPFLLSVNAGDTFSVIKGCDKTLSTCANTLRANGTLESANYQTRFGGTPFVPPPSSAI